jgi:uncharacterized RDD family membrane protein YckC
MSGEQTSQPGLYGQYAGFFTRLVAYAIDQLIVAGIIALIGTGVNLALNALNLSEWLATHPAAALIVTLFILGLVVFVRLFYNMGFWMLAGQTPGKRVMGVRVVRTDGHRLKWGNAIRREVGYWISAILFLGYLWVLVDNRRQAWHDKLAGTLVVYSWPEEGELPIQDRLQRFREGRSST